MANHEEFRALVKSASRIEAVTKATEMVMDAAGEVHTYAAYRAEADFAAAERIKKGGKKDEAKDELHEFLKREYLQTVGKAAIKADGLLLTEIDRAAASNEHSNGVGIISVVRGMLGPGK
jgi:hypothetical protein